MNKNSILIAIVVIMFGAAGIILYRGFFTKPGPSNQGTGSTAIVSEKTGEKILPYGSNLDFSLVKKFNGGTKFFSYPVVSANEITVPLQNLIK